MKQEEKESVEGLPPGLVALVQGLGQLWDQSKKSDPSSMPHQDVRMVQHALKRRREEHESGDTRGRDS